MTKRDSLQVLQMRFEPSSLALSLAINPSYSFYKPYDLDFLRTQDQTCQRYFQPLFDEIFLNCLKFKKKTFFELIINLPEEFIFEILLSDTPLPKHQKERELILAFQKQIQANLNDFAFFLGDKKNKGYALRKSLIQSLEPCFAGFPIVSISYCLLTT